MNLNDVGKINKFQNLNQVKNADKKFNDSQVEFSEILEKELSQAIERTDKSTPIIHSQNILNIKNTSLHELFLKKGVETYKNLTNTLEKFKNLLGSDNFKVEDTKSAINDLKELIGKLENITSNIEDIDIKNEFNRAILIGNVEIEKYLRGEYF